MAGRLFLIERPQDIARAVRLMRSGDSACSLSPEASLHLELAGRPYRILEEFVETGAFNADALDRYARLDAWVEGLDRRLRAAAPRLADLGAGPAAAHYWALKILFDSLASKALLLTRACAALRPGDVFYTPSRAAGFGRDLFFERESVFSLLIPQAERACGFHAVPLGPPGCFGVPRPGLLRRLRPARWPALLDRAFGRLLAKFPAVPADGPLVWYLEATHDVPALLERLKREGWAVRRALNDESELAGPEGRALAAEFGPALGRLWLELESEKAWRDALIFHGLDCFPAAQSRLERFITEAPLGMAVAAAAWTRRLRERRPACVLSSTSIVGWTGQAACAAARREGIPVILYQEGAGFGLPAAPIYEHTDLRSCDLFLAYGEGLLRSLEARGIRPECSVRAVGSARLEALGARLRGAGPAGGEYVYAPTHLHGNIQHHPYNGGTAAYYFEAQKRLIERFASFPESRFVIKPPPGAADTATTCRLAAARGRLRNCRAVLHAPLENLLAQAAGIILDFPSTTLLEALMTEKPIFLILDPWLSRLDPQAAEALSRRAVLCKNIDEFASAFARHLRGERVFDPSDARARRLYAVPEEGSLERAARTLIESFGDMVPASFKKSGAA